ncbi:MAG TPA: response regulator transcription factor [Capillimicrobium sp.]
MKRLRVLIADDHPLFRFGLRALFDREDDLDCVALASNGAEAIELARFHRPDVVVLDLHMPELDGIEATRRIVAELPGTGVLLLTMSDDDQAVLDAMRSGARGYVLKGSDEDDVVRAVRAVANGDAILGPAVAESLLDRLAASPSKAAQAFPELTSREREVVDLLARGTSNGQIALQLDLSPKTVRNHVSSICNKLQVVDRAQAALVARDAGFGR